MTAGPANRLRRLARSDLLHSLKSSPATVAAALVAAAFVTAALLAPWLAPHDTRDLAGLDLTDAFRPPAWVAGGDARFPLGTDEQGRDVLSAIMFGLRISLLVGLTAVALAGLLGTFLGLVSGYTGGVLDGLLMRLADVQLTFPAFLTALLVNGIAGSLLAPALHRQLAIPILVLAIAASLWVGFARTVRASTMVEATKEYVQAAQVIGVPPALILLRHVLPNVRGPVLVIATLSLAGAILTEATLSFLGVGLPATRPSLGTLIRIGNDFLFSGEWWMTIFPAAVLVALVLAVNLLGDWLRDALNPRLR